MSTQTYADTLARLLHDTVGELPAISLPLGEAIGWRLAADVLTKHPSPRFDNSQMDGYGIGYANANMALVGGTATGTARALTQVPGISFAWIMPCSLTVLMVGAWALSFEFPNRKDMVGLTWNTRKQPCHLVEELADR